MCGLICVEDCVEKVIFCVGIVEDFVIDFSVVGFFLGILMLVFDEEVFVEWWLNVVWCLEIFFDCEILLFVVVDILVLLVVKLYFNFVEDVWGSFEILFELVMKCVFVFLVDLGLLVEVIVENFILLIVEWIGEIFVCMFEVVFCVFDGIVEIFVVWRFRVVFGVVVELDNVVFLFFIVDLEKLSVFLVDWVKLVVIGRVVLVEEVFFISCGVENVVEICLVEFGIFWVVEILWVMIVVVVFFFVVKEFFNFNVVNLMVGICFDVFVDIFLINDVLLEMFDDFMIVVDIVIFIGILVFFLLEGEVFVLFIVVGDVMLDNRDVVLVEKLIVDDYVVFFFWWFVDDFVVFNKEFFDVDKYCSVKLVDLVFDSILFVVVDIFLVVIFIVVLGLVFW